MPGSEAQPQGRTAVIYMRTSGRGQREKATIKMQRPICMRLVKQHGVTLLPYGVTGDGIMVDDGISGRLLEGRCFEAFITDVRAGKLKPDYLIVYSASRLSRVDMFNADPELQIRSEMDEALINSTLRSHRVKVIDPDGIHDDLRPQNIHSSKEIKDTRRRTMDGKARCLEEGKFAQGGKPSYGYRQVLLDQDNRDAGWTLEVHPIDGPNLLQVFNWFVEGGYSYAARQATSAQLPMAKSRKPGVWDPVTIQGLVLKASTYLGHRTVMLDGRGYDQACPPLIDVNLLQAIERKSRERSLKRRSTFLGTGFIECACKALIAQHQSSKYTYTRCTKGCGSMREDLFSEALWNSVVTHWVAFTISGPTKPTSPENYAARVTDVTSRLAKVVHGQEALADLVLDGMDKTIWRKKNDALNVQKSQLQAELTQLKIDRDNNAKKTIHEQDMVARAASQLARWRERPPTLEEKREALADALNGGRVIVRFGSKATGTNTTLSLEPWGPSVTASTTDLRKAVALLTTMGPENMSWQAEDDGMPLAESP